MDLYGNELYMDDVRYTAGLELPWDRLQGRSILLSGSTGQIGSFFVDVVMQRNCSHGLNCTLYALCRDEKRARARFGIYTEDPRLVIIPHDVNHPLSSDNIGNTDFVLHLASNTHPVQYSTDPIGTITTNIIGLKNMLDAAVDHNAQRFVFASSNEIYGENRGDTELFDEGYCGYIDPNTMRAGYPESKRCGESMCQAYMVQKGLDIVIPRLTRTYGPTVLASDTKAISQFINRAVAGEDILLKSEGNQYYSFQYVADSVSGLLTVMLCGKKGEAYNIASENGDIKLKDLAELIAEVTGKKVVYDIPDSVEAAGYSNATKARLNGQKLRELGWKPRYGIVKGVGRTIQILKS